MTEFTSRVADSPNRRTSIGGSDARIIMGNDEDALVRLWQEKRGEIEPEDLSSNLIVQLGLVTEPLNRHWYEPIPVKSSLTSNAASSIRSCAGWPLLLTAWLKQWGGFRSEIHAAVVVLGRGGG